jgi:hypothetical protein
MDAAPLPQRSRKVRNRTGADAVEIPGDSEDLRLDMPEDVDAVESGPHSTARKRRIDAAEYFGVELAVPAGRAIDVVPSSFVEFEPHLTSFNFECACLGLSLLPVRHCSRRVPF